MRKMIRNISQRGRGAGWLRNLLVGALLFGSHTITTAKTITFSGDEWTTNNHKRVAFNGTTDAGWSTREYTTTGPNGKKWIWMDVSDALDSIDPGDGIVSATLTFPGVRRTLAEVNPVTYGIFEVPGDDYGLDAITGEQLEVNDVIDYYAEHTSYGTVGGITAEFSEKTFDVTELIRGWNKGTLRMNPGQMMLLWDRGADANGRNADRWGNENQNDDEVATANRPVLTIKTGKEAFDEVLEITRDGKIYRLQMHEVQLLAPDFRLLVQEATPAIEAEKSNYVQQSRPMFANKVDDNGDLILNEKGLPSQTLADENGVSITSDTHTLTNEIYVYPFTNNAVNNLYYLDQTKTLEIPTFYFGDVADQPGWMVSAFGKKDGTFSGHLVGPRGKHFTFIDFAEGVTGVISAESRPVLSKFYDRLLGGTVALEDFSAEDSGRLEILEYELVWDSDYLFYKKMGLDKAPAKLKGEALITYAMQAAADDIFLGYTDVASTVARNALLLSRLKTLVVRTDKDADPLTATEQLKPGIKNMWGLDHDKGIIVSKKYGSGNANRGGFGSHAPRHTTGSYIHEHAHTLGAQHSEGGMPEQFDLMNLAKSQIRRISGPTVLALRNDSRKDTGFKHIEPMKLGIPPYAALDTAMVRRGSSNTVSIAVLANDVTFSGANIKLVSVDETSVHGQSVKIVNGNVQYRAPDNWIGLDTFQYTVRVQENGHWLYGTGLVHVDVHNRVKRYEAEVVATKKQKKDAWSFQGAHKDAFVDMTKSNTNTLTWTVNVPTKGYYGAHIRYQGNDPKKTGRIDFGHMVNDTFTSLLSEAVLAQGGIRIPPQPLKKSNLSQWGTLHLEGIKLPAGDQIFKLKWLSGEVRIDSFDLVQDYNVQVNFESGVDTVVEESNYLIDQGAVFGVQESGGGRLSYGWSTAKQNLQGEGRRRFAQNRILVSTIPLDADSWSIEVPNGRYHLSIYCGHSFNEIAQTNNLLVNEYLLEDLDGSIVPDITYLNAPVLDPVDHFTLDLVVTNQLITIKAGAGALAPSLSYLEISAFNAPPIAEDGDELAMNQGAAAMILDLHSISSDVESEDAELTYSLPRLITELGNGVDFNNLDEFEVAIEGALAGIDHFDYIVTDPQGLSATGTITVVVSPSE